MRMWLVNPKILCRQHLLGEHNELHMLVGTINKGIRIDGYLDNNLIEVNNIKKRHIELATEMKRRGYNHKSPLNSFRYKGRNGKIDRKVSQNELFRRCPTCKENSIRGKI